MKKQKIKNLALMGLIGLCFSTNPLAAWERKAMDECKSDRKNCSKDSSQCRKNLAKCKKNAVSDDESSFESRLSPYSRTVFMRFNQKQRKKALDHADHNKMSPDDAVAKVTGDCYCPR